MQTTEHGDSRVFRALNPTIVLAGLAMGLLLLISGLSLRHIKNNQQQVIGEHLQASLNSVTEQLLFWQRQHLGGLRIIIQSPVGAPLIREQLRAGVPDNTQRKALHDWLWPILDGQHIDGFFLVNMEHYLIDASTESYIGRKVQLAETQLTLNKALARRPNISHPAAVPYAMEGPRGHKPAGTLIQNMCALVEEDGQPLGYVCLRFNSQSSFFPLISSGRVGQSGEIYAIAASGKLISPSRFNNTANIHVSEQGDAIQVRELYAREPGIHGQQGPLTRMAAALIARNDVSLLMDYRDYRGVAVVGAGRWLEDLDMGIIVEQDLDEAFASYTVARNLVIGLSLSAITLILLLTLSAMINRRRLAKREGHFRSLLNHIPAPVYMCALDGTLTVVNPAFCALVNIVKSDLLGQPLRAMAAPRWLSPLLSTMERAIAKRGLSDVHLVLRTPTGEQKYFHVLHFPVVYEASGAYEALACFILDETERLVANQHMENINQRLEQLVDERTVELIQAKEEALAASRAKADFLANMSHEIRTPLNAIIGLAHVALAMEMNPNLRNYLQKMRASGEHLLEVINDILNFSRLEAGKLKLDQVEFALVDVIQRAINLVSDKAEAKGLSLQVEIAPEISPWLKGDPLRLGQILINLCANAVKFTDQGCIQLLVQQKARRGDAINLIIDVRDTGIGIAPGLLASLFQPFHQVDNSNTRRFEGTGLGLAICKSLADLMDAHLSVESEMGKGSCFRLDIWLDAAEGHGQANGLERALLSTREQECALCGRVLVVEDNSLNQEIAQTLLQTWGCAVTLADNGSEALALAAQALPDLVLMDIQLPGMDGLETSRRLRQLPGAARLPIVALTANALPGDREAYLAAGMDDYIAKPIDPRQLYLLLQRWLSPRQPSQPDTRPHQQGASPWLIRPGSAIPPNAVMPEPVLSLPVFSLDTFAALEQAGLDTRGALGRLMNKYGLYYKLLVRFATERNQFPAELTQALDEGDNTAALNQVHGLKSLAGSLGMLELAGIAADCEQQLNQGALAPDSLDKLSILLRDMVTLINAWLQQLDAVELPG